MPDTATAPPLDDRAAELLRADFPILSRTVNGHPLVYLDSGATSQKPQSVIDVERAYYETTNAAVHRGAHTLAGEATELFEDARATVAAFVGARPEEIVWTSNATEGLNLIAYGMSNATLGRGGEAARRFRLGEGDEIVVTELEHHANLVPWQELAFRTGATLRVIGLTDDGRLDLGQAAELIGERTRVVAFAHVSNVLGTVNPVAELVALAHGVGALVVLDACQSAPHMPLDLGALDVDFAVFSGHKMLAPTGIGVLYGKQELLDALPPFLTGGSMITTVGLTESEFLPAPLRFEAGTQRVSQAIALAEAVRYLEGVGLDRIHAWESELGLRLHRGLSAIEGVRVLGPAPDARGGVERVGLASFVVEGVHAHDVGQFLDDRGIAVRVGHHCAQPAHRRYGVTATTRASAYLYNTTADVDAAVAAVADSREFFGLA
ncbi:SufS family cysteine desulfurase [Herbiconiux sp. KACC 21604]|uniref:SufS family cysteine desulfurase n=1 Tax=unclassified Herbiconiux TaxID=2618217 RepID=UPI0014928A52|nr:SufS family cysteine desulfurase [Herbiconiux sp. SALV-R1]WPO88715.1 SufS family cysteine desulfurase [Herbiconiux sp. KACC 21604]